MIHKEAAHIHGTSAQALKLPVSRSDSEATLSGCFWGGVEETNWQTQAGRTGAKDARPYSLGGLSGTCMKLRNVSQPDPAKPGTNRKSGNVK